ncbi:MAG: transglutaminase domain-containing protein [Candidatus Tectomicrobia bacterium]|nr:transglutaminase domain-containing protein [Candidatus Tectomicrobia bacterium]
MKISCPPVKLVMMSLLFLMLASVGDQRSLRATEILAPPSTQAHSFPIQHLSPDPMQRFVRLLDRLHQHLLSAARSPQQQNLPASLVPHRTIVRTSPKREDRPKQAEQAPSRVEPREDLVQVASFVEGDDLVGLGFPAVVPVPAPPPPTPDDLTDDVHTRFDPLIRARAAQLNHHPVQIFEWVRNTTEFQPYYGSLKGAVQTLREGEGNAVDMASLLIALFRVSGFPPGTEWARSRSRRRKR